MQRAFFSWLTGKREKHDALHRHGEADSAKQEEKPLENVRGHPRSSDVRSLDSTYKTLVHNQALYNAGDLHDDQLFFSLEFSAALLSDIVGYASTSCVGDVPPTSLEPYEFHHEITSQTSSDGTGEIAFDDALMAIERLSKQGHGESHLSVQDGRMISLHQNKREHGRISYGCSLNELEPSIEEIRVFNETSTSQFKDNSPALSFFEEGNSLMRSLGSFSESCENSSRSHPNVPLEEWNKLLKGLIHQIAEGPCQGVTKSEQCDDSFRVKTFNGQNSESEIWFEISKALQTVRGLVNHLNETLLETQNQLQLESVAHELCRQEKNELAMLVGCLKNSIEKKRFTKFSRINVIRYELNPATPQFSPIQSFSKVSVGNPCRVRYENRLFGFSCNSSRISFYRKNLITEHYLTAGVLKAMSCSSYEQPYYICLIPCFDPRLISCSNHFVFSSCKTLSRALRGKMHFGLPKRFLRYCLRKSQKLDDFRFFHLIPFWLYQRMTPFSRLLQIFSFERRSMFLKQAYFVNVSYEKISKSFLCTLHSQFKSSVRYPILRFIAVYFLDKGHIEGPLYNRLKAFGFFEKNSKKNLYIMQMKLSEFQRLMLHKSGFMLYKNLLNWGRFKARCQFFHIPKKIVRPCLVNILHGSLLDLYSSWRRSRLDGIANWNDFGTQIREVSLLEVVFCYVKKKALRHHGGILNSQVACRLIQGNYPKPKSTDYFCLYKSLGIKSTRKYQWFCILSGGLQPLCLSQDSLNVLKMCLLSRDVNKNSASVNLLGSKNLKKRKSGAQELSISQSRPRRRQFVDMTSVEIPYVTFPLHFPAFNTTCFSLPRSSEVITELKCCNIKRNYLGKNVRRINPDSITMQYNASTPSSFQLNLPQGFFDHKTARNFSRWIRYNHKQWYSLRHDFHNLKCAKHPYSLAHFVNRPGVTDIGVLDEWTKRFVENVFVKMPWNISWDKLFGCITVEEARSFMKPQQHGWRCKVPVIPLKSFKGSAFTCQKILDELRRAHGWPRKTQHKFHLYFIPLVFYCLAWWNCVTQFVILCFLKETSFLNLLDGIMKSLYCLLQFLIECRNNLQRCNRLNVLIKGATDTLYKKEASDGDICRCKNLLNALWRLNALEQSNLTVQQLLWRVSFRDCVPKAALTSCQCLCDRSNTELTSFFLRPSNVKECGVAENKQFCNELMAFQSLDDFGDKKKYKVVSQIPLKKIQCLNAFYDLCLSITQCSTDQWSLFRLRKNKEISDLFDASLILSCLIPWNNFAFCFLTLKKVARFRRFMQYGKLDSNSDLRIEAVENVFCLTQLVFSNDSRYAMSRNSSWLASVQFNALDLVLLYSHAELSQDAHGSTEERIAKEIDLKMQKPILTIKTLLMPTDTFFLAFYVPPIKVSQLNSLPFLLIFSCNNLERPYSQLFSQKSLVDTSVDFLNDLSIHNRAQQSALLGVKCDMSAWCTKRLGEYYNERISQNRWPRFTSDEEAINSCFFVKKPTVLRGFQKRFLFKLSEANVIQHQLTTYCALDQTKTPTKFSPSVSMFNENPLSNEIVVSQWTDKRSDMKKLLVVRTKSSKAIVLRGNEYLLTSHLISEDMRWVRCFWWNQRNMLHSMLWQYIDKVLRLERCNSRQDWYGELNVLFWNRNLSFLAPRCKRFNSLFYLEAPGEVRNSKTFRHIRVNNMQASLDVVNNDSIKTQHLAPKLYDVLCAWEGMSLVIKKPVSLNFGKTLVRILYTAPLYVSCYLNCFDCTEGLEGIRFLKNSWSLFINENKYGSFLLNHVSRGFNRKNQWSGILYMSQLLESDVDVDFIFTSYVKGYPLRISQGSYHNRALGSNLDQRNTLRRRANNSFKNFLESYSLSDLNVWLRLGRFRDHTTELCHFYRFSRINGFMRKDSATCDVLEFHEHRAQQHFANILRSALHDKSCIKFYNDYLSQGVLQRISSWKILLGNPFLAVIIQGPNRKFSQCPWHLLTNQGLKLSLSKVCYSLCFKKFLHNNIENNVRNFEFFLGNVFILLDDFEGSNVLNFLSSHGLRHEKWGYFFFFREMLFFNAISASGAWILKIASKNKQNNPIICDQKTFSSATWPQETCFSRVFLYWIMEKQLRFLTHESLHPNYHVRECRLSFAVEQKSFKRMKWKEVIKRLFLFVHHTQKQLESAMNALILSSESRSGQDREVQLLQQGGVHWSWTWATPLQYWCKRQKVLWPLKEYVYNARKNFESHSKAVHQNKEALRVTTQRCPQLSQEMVKEDKRHSRVQKILDLVQHIRELKRNHEKAILKGKKAKDSLTHEIEMLKAERNELIRMYCMGIKQQWEFQVSLCRLGKMSKRREQKLNEMQRAVVHEKEHSVRLNVQLRQTLRHQRLVKASFKKLRESYKELKKSYQGVVFQQEQDETMMLSQRLVQQNAYLQGVVEERNLLKSQLNELQNQLNLLHKFRQYILQKHTVSFLQTSSFSLCDFSSQLDAIIRYDLRKEANLWTLQVCYLKLTKLCRIRACKLLKLKEALRKATQQTRSLDFQVYKIKNEQCCMEINWRLKEQHHEALQDLYSKSTETCTRERERANLLEKQYKALEAYLQQRLEQQSDIKDALECLQQRFDHLQSKYNIQVQMCDTLQHSKQYTEKKLSRIEESWNHIEKHCTQLGVETRGMKTRLNLLEEAYEKQKEKQVKTQCSLDQTQKRLENIWPHITLIVNRCNTVASLLPEFVKRHLELKSSYEDTHVQLYHTQQTLKEKEECLLRLERAGLTTTMIGDIDKLQDIMEIYEKWGPSNAMKYQSWVESLSRMQQDINQTRQFILELLDYSKQLALCGKHLELKLDLRENWFHEKSLTCETLEQQCRESQVRFQECQVQKETFQFQLHHVTNRYCLTEARLWELEKSYLKQRKNCRYLCEQMSKTKCEMQQFTRRYLKLQSFFHDVKQEKQMLQERIAQFEENFQMHNILHERTVHESVEAKCHAKTLDYQCQILTSELERLKPLHARTLQSLEKKTMRYWDLIKFYEALVYETYRCEMRREDDYAHAMRYWDLNKFHEALVCETYRCEMLREDDYAHAMRCRRLRMQQKNASNVPLEISRNKNLYSFFPSDKGDAKTQIHSRAPVRLWTTVAVIHYFNQKTCAYSFSPMPNAQSNEPHPISENRNDSLSDLTQTLMRKTLELTQKHSSVDLENVAHFETSFMFTPKTRNRTCPENVNGQLGGKVSFIQENVSEVQDDSFMATSYSNPPEMFVKKKKLGAPRTMEDIHQLRLSVSDSCKIAGGSSPSMSFLLKHPESNNALQGKNLLRSQKSLSKKSLNRTLHDAPLTASDHSLEKREGKQHVNLKHEENEAFCDFRIPHKAHGLFSSVSDTDCPEHGTLEDTLSSPRDELDESNSNSMSIIVTHDETQLCNEVRKPLITQCKANVFVPKLKEYENNEQQSAGNPFFSPSRLHDWIQRIERLSYLCVTQFNLCSFWEAFKQCETTCFSLLLKVYFLKLCGQIQIDSTPGSFFNCDIPLKNLSDHLDGVFTSHLQALPAEKNKLCQLEAENKFLKKKQINAQRDLLAFTDLLESTTKEIRMTATSVHRQLNVVERERHSVFSVLQKLKDSFVLIYKCAMQQSLNQNMLYKEDSLHEWSENIQLWTSAIVSQIITLRSKSAFKPSHNLLPTEGCHRKTQLMPLRSKQLCVSPQTCGYIVQNSISCRPPLCPLFKRHEPFKALIIACSYQSAFSLYPEAFLEFSHSDSSSSISCYLPGSFNDAVSWMYLLRATGWTSHNVKVLCEKPLTSRIDSLNPLPFELDEEPTKQNILNGLSWLTQDVHAGQRIALIMIGCGALLPQVQPNQDPLNAAHFLDRFFNDKATFDPCFLPTDTLVTVKSSSISPVHSKKKGQRSSSQKCCGGMLQSFVSEPGHKTLHVTGIPTHIILNYLNRLPTGTDATLVWDFGITESAPRSTEILSVNPTGSIPLTFSFHHKANISPFIPRFVHFERFLYYLKKKEPKTLLQLSRDSHPNPYLLTDRAHFCYHTLQPLACQLYFLSASKGHADAYETSIKNRISGIFSWAVIEALQESLLNTSSEVLLRCVIKKMQTLITHDPRQRRRLLQLPEFLTVPQALWSRTIVPF